MKKIVLTLTILACAFAIQAGEGKTCSKAKVASCDAKSKAACAAKIESGCCPRAAAAAKGTCPKAQAAKKSLMSPKAAGEAAK